MSRIHRIHRRLSQIAFVLWTIRTFKFILWTVSLGCLATLVLSYLVMNGWRGESVLYLFIFTEGGVALTHLLYAVYQGFKLSNHHRIARYTEGSVTKLNDALLTVISAEKDPNLGSAEVIEALQEDVAQKLEEEAS